MARITVPFNGLTSHPNHKDGECSNLVNLRPKNGYLKPVPPRKKILYELSNTYDIVFIHRGSNYENWIGIQNYAGGSVIHTNLNAENHHYFKNLDESINSVQQIGNTLSLVTDTTIHYVLWKDGQYRFLGEIPELPVVDFSTTEMSPKSKTYLEEYGTSPIWADTNNGEGADIQLEQTIGLTKSIIEENRSMFHDAFLITYALRLYDGSIIKHSSPVLVMPREGINNWGEIYMPGIGGEYADDNSKITLKFYRLSASYAFSNLSDWKDIIKSVDFFTTNYIGFGSPDNITRIVGSRNSRDTFRLFEPYGRGYTRRPLLPVVDFIDSLEDKVVRASEFYLYFSEDDFSSKSTDFPNNKVTVKDNYYNIIHQEDMPPSSFSHHKVGATNASVYNNRLRLSSIRTSLYQGHPLSQFKWGSAYNGTGIGANNIPIGSYIYVTIKTEHGEYVVRRKVDTTNLFLNAFISYPDPRATKLRIVGYDPISENTAEVLSVNLSPHPTLNIAYAINDDLKPFLVDIIALSNTPHYHSNPSYLETNKIKVSEVNNPFVFPSANTYLIGNGEILAESSIIMNVTDRNYGMYPVFVFTTDGVFTMAGQTAESVHDSIQAPTYLEPPISNVIAPTPYGVVFITQRGLMQISQYQTSFLSPQLREDDDTVVLSQKDEIVGDTISYPVIPFTTFLKSAKAMLYNPYHDELIIASRGNPYCYVYDFASKSFYISTETIDVIVQNSFPDIYTLNDNYHIKDYSQYESKQSQISLITRPLSFGTSDIKTLHRIWLRALMHNVINMSVVAFHSLDGVNYQPAKGATFGGEGDENNYKDFDLGLFARETYRKYIFLLTGTVDEDTQIRYAEFEISKRYDNDKMR